MVRRARRLRSKGEALISVFLRAFAAVETVSRGAWTVLVGLLFLALGFSFKWYSPPSSRLSSFDAGALNLVTFEPEEAILLRLLVLVVAAFLLFGLLRGERHRFAMRAGPWVLLAATLAFPYVI